MLAVEYPTYGLYSPAPPLEEETIKEDAEIVYSYLRYSIGLAEKQIIVFGRSIGSGPAVHLASKHNPLMLFLFSPFKSIREAAAALTFSLLAKFIKERFRNIDHIDKVKSPVLIIHGKEDKIVPVSHSEELFYKCIAEKKKLVVSQTMSHNQFDISDDLINPLLNFLIEHKFDHDSYSPIDIRLFFPFAILERLK